MRLVGALIAAVLAYGAGAPPRLLDGPAFSIDLAPLGLEAGGRDLGVGVVVSGSLGSGAVAHVHVSALGGLQIVAGDPSFSAPLVGLVPMHILHVRGRGPGPCVLYALATVVQGGKERAVAEVALPVQAGGDTLTAGPRAWPRSEFVYGDQRYRVSGSWLVPIDAPEEVSPADLLTPRAKPAVVAQAAAKCPGCDASLASLRVLVVVDRSGAVQYAQVLGDGHSGAAADSVQAAAARWRFTPARIGRTPVTDCIVVAVPISR